MPAHEYTAADKGKASFELTFACLADRDAARAALAGAGVRFRTGKALVPFRITGNIEWGVPAPELPGDEAAHTVWCWPESLWAPVSFTRAALEHPGEVQGLNGAAPAAVAAECADWREYWCSGSAEVYQFIGQDNIYFYGIAQPAIWEALGEGGEGRALTQTTLIANYHVLFMNKKASSSGAIKPPMAADLLDYYTAEQLRAHFLALGLGLKPVSFQPKALDSAANEKAPDPVLRDGQIFTNVLNRLARSCFYEAQKGFNGCMPLGEPAAVVREDCKATVLAYEQAMQRFEFHAVLPLVGEFARRANKYWTEGIKAAGESAAAHRQVLVDSFYYLRCATVLSHPIVPGGAEMVRDYLELGVPGQEFFSWEHIFEGYEPFCTEADLAAAAHPLRELPPRTDFFKKHPSQFV
jgi:methionyl-tRNA synthetase